MLKLRGLLEIAAEQDMTLPASRVHHAHSWAPARVELPAMPIGAGFLERWPVHQEPGTACWRDADYECMAPALFVLRDVIVHGASGIIQIGDAVVGDSLAARDPEVHGYALCDDGVELRTRQVRHLGGAWISLLAGNSRNYFHAMMDGVFRLAMIPAGYVTGATGLLHPAGAVGQRAMLDLAGLPHSLQRREVGGDEALHLEAMIFPWTVYGLSSYHPCVSAFLDRISAQVPGDGDFPAWFYVDRGASPQRRLVNEDEVVAALERQGFVAVRPETLGVVDQIRLFRGARAIVAPHGAALTNLGFCRPGTRVLELQMDAYTHWGFRHLAALRRLSYDCVLGRAIADAPDIHAVQWQVSATHVAAAAERLFHLAETDG